MGKSVTGQLGTSNREVLGSIPDSSIKKTGIEVRSHAGSALLFKTITVFYLTKTFFIHFKFPHNYISH